MKFILAAIISFGLAVPSLSADADRDEFLNAMTEAAEWISENSDLEWDGKTLPALEFESKEMLQITAYGEQSIAKAEMEGYELMEVDAVYKDTETTIVLRDDFELDSKKHQLVHEMVHFLQHHNGVLDDCPGANEPLAYKLHEEWLMEQGIEVVEGENTASGLYVVHLQASCHGGMWY